MLAYKETVKDEPTHTHAHTLTNTERLQQLLFKLSLQCSLLYFLYSHQSTSFQQSNSTTYRSQTDVVHTYTGIQTTTATRRTHTVYWTLRVRADTPWCQSLSSLYLGPITIRVVDLFTLPSQEGRKGREKNTKRDREKMDLGKVK